MADRPDALVIGAGPAGLMAAEVLVAGGAGVLLAEAMPTPARKFLMAGKSGLNLTKNQPFADFTQNFTFGPGFPGDSAFFGAGPDRFGPAEVMAWAQGLGITLFTGSTGRVFPTGMKASPLLRAWLARLQQLGVDLRTRWRWTGMQDGFDFQTPEGRQLVVPRVAVLALGGGSWARLGSDAAWVPILRDAAVPVADLRSANMGFHVDWSVPMARHFGAAVKGTAMRAGDMRTRGEWIIGRQGIEGGGIYEIAAAIRDGAQPVLDLAPDLDSGALARRFARPRGRLSLGNWLRRVLGDPVRVALLLEWGGPLPADPAGWAARAKDLPIRHAGPMGLQHAISSAGGLGWQGLRDGLELMSRPGLFAAGEMLDWEAPTGGYLLSGCLASGRVAGRGALRRLGLPG